MQVPYLLKNLQELREFFHLPHFEFDRSLTTEHRNKNFENTLFGIDIADFAVHASKGTSLTLTLSPRLKGIWTIAARCSPVVAASLPILRICSASAAERLG